MKHNDRYFSLEVYSESNIYSFQFKIISNNKNLDECLYKIYSILFNNIFIEISAILNKDDLLNKFEFYLNENFTNGDVVPIYTSADEDTQNFLKFNSSYFRDNRGKRYYLNNLISLIINYDNSNGITFRKFSISFDKLMCPKKLVNGVNTNDILINDIYINQDIASLDYAIGFKIISAGYTYFIIFSKDDLETLFSDINHEIIK